MEFLKKSWKILVSIISAIIGLIFLKQFFTKDLKAKLNLANTEKESAVLDTKVDQVRNDISKENQTNSSLREDANKPAPDLSPKEREDFWNKK